MPAPRHADDLGVAAGGLDVAEVAAQVRVDDGHAHAGGPPGLAAVAELDRAQVAVDQREVDLPEAADLGLARGRRVGVDAAAGVEVGVLGVAVADRRVGGVDRVAHHGHGHLAGELRDALAVALLAVALLYARGVAVVVVAGEAVALGVGATEAEREPGQQLRIAIRHRAERRIEGRVVAAVGGERVEAEHIGDLKGRADLGAEDRAGDVGDGRQQGAGIQRADRPVAAAAGRQRALDAAGQRRVRVVDLRQVVLDRQRREELGGVELHRPDVVALRREADVGETRAVVADHRLERAAEHVGHLMHAPGLQLVGVDVEHVVAVAGEQDVRAVRGPARLGVEEAVGGDPRGLLRLAVVHVDVAVAALPPARVGDPAAVGGPARREHLTETVVAGLDLDDGAGVQVEEGEPRLAGVVAREHDRATVGRDVGVTGAVASRQRLDVVAVAAVPQHEVGPLVAEVVDLRDLEDHVLGAEHE